LYRRTIVPQLRNPPSGEQLDQQVLNISRVSTVVVMLLCMGLAWMIQKTNISLIVWIGNGGMMAAFAGPLVMGALWRGVTRKGAYAGLAAGFVSFLILHTQFLNFSFFGPILSSEWMDSGMLRDVVQWFEGEAPNPFSCAAMGEGVSIVTTFVVSKLTKPLPQQHLDEMFETA
jgi:Na+/proline symporter